LDPTEPSRLTATYNITAAGVHLLELRLRAAAATTATEQTRGFAVTVSALPTPAIRMSGVVQGTTTLKLVAGTPASVRAMLRDAFGNVVLAAGFHLSAVVRSTTASMDEEAEEGWQLPMREAAEGVHELHLTLYDAGNYSLRVYLGSTPLGMGPTPLHLAAAGTSLPCTLVAEAGGSTGLLTAVPSPLLLRAGDAHPLRIFTFDDRLHPTDSSHRLGVSVVASPDHQNRNATLWRPLHAPAFALAEAEGYSLTLNGTQAPSKWLLWLALADSPSYGPLLVEVRACEYT
jgi:hypothetical protein